VKFCVWQFGIFAFFTKLGSYFFGPVITYDVKIAFIAIHLDTARP